MKFRAQVILAASLFIANGCGDTASPPQPVSNDSELLASFVDDFVLQYEFEESTDLSAASFAKELQQTRSFLARLHEIDTSTLTTDEKIDWQFAKSILRGAELASCGGLHSSRLTVRQRVPVTRSAISSAWTRFSRCVKSIRNLREISFL